VLLGGALKTTPGIGTAYDVLYRMIHGLLRRLWLLAVGAAGHPAKILYE
jgi:hypothetical protein